MWFRNLFKRMVGERPQEVTSAASQAPTDNQVSRPVPTPESTHREPERETVIPERLSTTVLSETDSMKLAQMRQAEKLRVRIVVRGIQQYGRNGFSGIFAPGERVSLERDPSNPHDANAVKVLLSDGSMLGYVAREMAGEISHELAEGWKFKVRIAVAPYVEEKWGQCELEVMDKDAPEKKEAQTTVQESSVQPKKRKNDKAGFIPPLNFGDEWHYGKTYAIRVAELEWLYALYSPCKSTSEFEIRIVPAATILSEERQLTGKRDEDGRHLLRSLLSAFAIKDDAVAAEYIRDVGKLTGECAARCVDKLLPALSDARIKEFIVKCIDMGSVNAYAEKCWDVNRAVLDKKTSVLNALAAVGMKPRIGSCFTMTGRHMDANIMYTSELYSPLSTAVDHNDVAEARYLIGYGADINQMMFESGGRGEDAWHLYSNPILMKVHSVEMYKLFVEAGVTLYPRSYTYRGKEKSYGEEHNLLDAIWKGPAMDEAAVELADYLVVTEYDMPLRVKIDEIKSSFKRDDGGPYKNNKAYVLEWCDMEKRAIDAIADRAFEVDWDKGDEGPYITGWADEFLHDFYEVWADAGYNEAVRLHREFFDRDATKIPPRYIYPERIVKRGVQHGVS